MDQHGSAWNEHDQHGSTWVNMDLHGMSMISSKYGSTWFHYGSANWLISLGESSNQLGSPVSLPEEARLGYALQTKLVAMTRLLLVTRLHNEASWHQLPMGPLASITCGASVTNYIWGLRHQLHIVRSHPNS